MTRKEELAGFFDQGITITGEIEFKNILRIDGNFFGKVRSADQLIVGENGVVEGEVDVGILSVIGTVRGMIRVHNKLEIQKGGKVFADVVTPSLLLLEGALLQGNCEMDLKKKSQENSRLEHKAQEGS